MTAWLDPVRTDETSRAAVLQLDDVRKTYRAASRRCAGSRCVSMTGRRSR